MSDSKKPAAKAGQWTRVLAKLTDEMSNRQELSVPTARMDEFSPNFLAVMVSERVLTFDRQRYGFGHESLFDYRLLGVSRQVILSSLSFWRGINRNCFAGLNYGRSSFICATPISPVTCAMSRERSRAKRSGRI